MNTVNKPIIVSSDEKGNEKEIVYRYDLDDPIVFSIKGNYTDKNYNFYSVDVLYDAYKKQVGNKIEFENYGKRVISKVDKKDDFIFIETLKFSIN